jgi:3-oxoadipate enol-lactonase
MGTMAVSSLHFSTDHTGSFAGVDNVLILGPSLGSDTHLWDLAAPTLAQRHTLVRFDLPGHGESEVAQEDFSLEDIASTIVAYADSAGIERFDYAGVSVSGALALELAYRYPDRVKHAAVVCSAAFFGGPAGWAERIELVSSAGTAAVVPSIPERWFAPDFLAKDPGTVEKLLRTIAATDNDSYIRVCRALGDFDARPFLQDITVPILVVSGELDPGAPVEAGAAIVSAVPGSRQVVIAGTSHQAVVEKPLELAQELVSFFAS